MAHNLEVGLPNGSEVGQAVAHPSYGGVAQNFISGHRLYRPILQLLHCPQATPGSSATRSPT